MRGMIEHLESRQMFSVAVGAMTHAVGHEPAVHASQHLAAATKYAGTLMDDSSAVLAKLQLALRPADVGYTADLTVQYRRGKPLKLALTFDATGAFTYDRTDGKRIMHADGQLSSDGSAIIGNWSDTRGDGSTQGTFSLSLVEKKKKSSSDGQKSNSDSKDGSSKKSGGDDSKDSSDHGEHVTPTPSPTPTPTPTPSPTASVTYDGTLTNSNGETGHVFIVVRKTDGGYRGEFHTSPGATSVVFMFDSKGHFNYDSTDGKFHIDGQLSNEGKMLAGNWSAIRDNGVAVSGTFSLTRT